jgi:hypothetical protein
MARLRSGASCASTIPFELLDRLAGEEEPRLEPNAGFYNHGQP